VGDAFARLSKRERKGYDELLQRLTSFDAISRGLAEVRIADLISYQGVAYARDYANFIVEVAARTRAVDAPYRQTIVQAAIRGLHKLMAYKDEYDVARMHTQPTFHTNARGLFNDRVRLSYNLHPPLLRALGLQKKVRLGEWFTPGLRVLAQLKVLRGTPFDVFRFTESRQIERNLPQWYRDAVARALKRCTPETYAFVEEIAAAPDTIRGYEGIKLRSVAATKQHVEGLLARLAVSRGSGDCDLAGGGA